jgi:hypothetical protein
LLQMIYYNLIMDIIQVNRTALVIYIITDNQTNFTKITYH